MEGHAANEERIRVALKDRGYDVHVGAGLIDRAGALIAPLAGGRPVVVVSDETVAPHYLDRVVESLSRQDLAAEAVILPPGEQTKSFAWLEHLTEACLERGIERGSLIVALGGGVVGDLAGFAAAILLRGIRYVQIPTTLLAQVDSAVGGKTAIDTPQGKNLVGAFHQPSLVIADTATLDSLPPRQLRAGYAEVAKYGLLGDAGFFAWLEENGEAVIGGAGSARTRAVAASCRAKAAVVAADEREAGDRALLNLGHTFGHALEAALGFGDRLLHGEAVALGTVLAFDLSARLGLCPPEDAARVRRHFAGIGLPIDLAAIAEPDWSAEMLLRLMQSDKKVRDGRLTFILARGIGAAEIRADIDPAEVRALLEAALAA